MSNLSNANNTNSMMHNLQNKRTLPRQVIKWMQGLDLSYSVKDYRKDMSNGFLIAQIVSRYEPGKIPMHAFENSHNEVRRENNWSQLSLFFSKYPLRQVLIELEDYDKIMKSNDPKSEQLYQLICRFYSICTKRTLPENTPILDLPPTQSNNPNFTASYLLKEDGLEKLSNNNSGILGSSAHNKSNGGNLDASKVQDHSQDRVPTRKIVPNLDGSSNMVDVLGIGIKNENRKMTSKRKSWQMAKQESNYSQENGQNEKLIFDYLNNIIQQCISADDHALRDLLLPQNAKFTPTQSLKIAIPNIDQEFYCNFLNQILLSIADLVPIILRQINETWKFFSYFIKMVRNYPVSSQQFALLYSVLRHYAVSSHQRQAKRIQKVFLDSLFCLLIAEVRAAKQWRKKEKIMQLLYDFLGRQPTEKKLALSKLKELIGSSNSLYVEWLAVLVVQQTAMGGSTSSNKLIEDYVYYAHQFIACSSVPLRTSALKILHELSKTSHCSLIEPYFLSKAVPFQSSRCDPEQIVLLILIYSNLLRELIASKEYQSLVKGNNTNNLIKVYNPDNQKNMEELKKKAALLGETIHRLFSGTSDISVREISARIAIGLISESKFMMQILLQFVSTVNDKGEFFKSAETEYELKSMSYNCPAISSSIFQEYSNEILVQVISIKLQSSTPIESFVYLVNHCLEHLNVKKVNMQIWEDISIHIAKPFCELAAFENYSTEAFEGLKHIANIYFNYDMKIRQFNGWLAESIFSINQSKNAICLQNIADFNQFLNTEYQRTRHESARFMIEQIAELLESRGLKNIIKVLQP